MKYQKKSSINRKQKRAREIEQRKSQQANGKSRSVTAGEVNAVVQQLNDNQRTLGKLINDTNKGVINAFTIQDGHLHVQRRIFNDLVKDVLKEGCEGTLKLLADGSIDWDWYFKEYERAKVAVALVMWFKKITGQQQESVAAVPEDDADLVFGGDYENSYGAAS